MDDAEAKRAYLCLVSGRALIGVFSPLYAARLGAVPALDVFGRIVAVTHAVSSADSVLTEGDEELVGLLDRDSIAHLNCAISVVTMTSTVYRGFVHFHTIPVSSLATPPRDHSGAANQDGS